ncbi:hypothetical protein [Agrobacterium rubi]|uniref:hypothetical protein n=1 Tax=Agrobacterium rubi TaxID=28099 RepID=UPI0015741AA5|nr:hypothetical protein [Agrobacterium rubi]NTF08005.1 hypothetical protein [Agrobacterium rubi]
MGVLDLDEEPPSFWSRRDDVRDKLSVGGLKVYIRESDGAARGDDTTSSVQIDHPSLGHSHSPVTGDDVFPEHVERGLARRGAFGCFLVGSVREVMAFDVTPVLGDQSSLASVADTSATYAVGHL